MNAISTADQITRCPFCGTNGLKDLKKLALSYEEFQMIEDCVRNGTIRDVLRIAEIALHRLDPDKMCIELQVSNAIKKLIESSNQVGDKFMEAQKQFVCELSAKEGKERELLIKEYENRHISLVDEYQRDLTNKSKAFEQLEVDRLRELKDLRENINDIKEKIIGTRIGDVGEIMTLLDLKKAVPEDSFSETRSAKHGSDIIATVRDKGRVCGNITVSVKFQNNWSGEFLEQLERNIGEDGTKWGILVSKAFPREALNSKVSLTEDQVGNAVLLVKPEYAPVAYIGLRQAVIHSFEAKQTVNSKENEVTHGQKILRALATWINGEEFEATLRLIDNAKKEAEKTRTSLHQIQNYLGLRVNDASKFQDNIIEHLMQAKSLLGNLKSLLVNSTATNTPISCKSPEEGSVKRS